MSNAIKDYGIPCAKESGITGDDLAKIQAGNFADLPQQYGCFSDCISKKVGLVTDADTFDNDAFKEKLASFVVENRIQEFFDGCSGKLGEGSCKVTGSFYHCIANIVLGAVIG